MVVFCITLADMSPNDSVYTVQYGRRFEEVTIPLDIWSLSVEERQKAIATMVSVLFSEERDAKMKERPSETPEAQMLQDLLDELAEDDEDDDD